MRILAFLLLLMSPAVAQVPLYLPVPSTPDLLVSATSTSEYSVRTSGRNSAVRWFSLKNDCQTTLYFAIAPNARGATDYPLRLGPGEAFTMEGRLHSVGASNDGSSPCTFTFQGAD